MSHTVVVNSVPIKDIDALEKVAAHLREHNKLECSLVRNVSPRMWAIGQERECDYVLRLPGKADVGFRKQKDGSYVPVFDNWDRSISPYLGVKEKVSAYNANDAERKIVHEYNKSAPIGQFLSLYTLYATMNEAMRVGHTIEGYELDEEGNYVLSVVPTNY